MAKVDWAHLCDHAFFDQSLKPCIIGIFRVIVAQRVPANHTKASLIYQVSGQPQETVRARIRIFRPDRDALIDVHQDVQLSEGGEGGAIINIDNMSLPDFGPYEIRIYVDDNDYIVPFQVARALSIEGAGRYE